MLYEVITETGADPMLETEPGNKAGPVAQGLNTRFGVYSGGGVVITSYSIHYTKLYDTWLGGGS